MSILTTAIAIFILVIIVLLILNVPLSQKLLNIIYGILILLLLTNQAGWIHF